jgi:hypothetical protein
MKGSPVRVRASALKALLRGYFCEVLSTFTSTERVLVGLALPICRISAVFELIASPHNPGNRPPAVHELEVLAVDTSVVRR